MIRLLVLVLAAATTGCAASARSGLPFYTGADFTASWQPTSARALAFDLRSQDGTALTAADLRGRIHVASFVYTRCSVICPVLVERLQAVQSAIASSDDVRMVSFSVDPDRDTAEALATYARDHAIDVHHWLLLTGDRSQIFRLARTFYFADDGRLSGSSGDFLHTEKVLLVDRQGRLRGIYNGTQRVDITRLIADLGALRSES
jgi:protein SCO1/2